MTIIVRFHGSKKKKIAAGRRWFFHPRRWVEISSNLFAISIPCLQQQGSLGIYKMKEMVANHVSLPLVRTEYAVDSTVCFQKSTRQLIGFKQERNVFLYDGCFYVHPFGGLFFFVFLSPIRHFILWVIAPTHPKTNNAAKKTFQKETHFSTPAFQVLCLFSH